MYIANYDNSVKLPWEEGLLEWLQLTYPNSRYKIVQYD